MRGMKATVRSSDDLRLFISEAWRKNAVCQGLVLKNIARGEK